MIEPSANEQSGPAPIVAAPGFPYFAAMQTTFARQTTENSTGATVSNRSVNLVTPGALTPKSSALAGAKPMGRARGQAVTGHGSKGLIEALMNSKVYQDYERAFTEATGLPVALRPVESWQLPHHG